MSGSNNQYLDAVAQAAQAEGINPKWAQATLLTENTPGNPGAVSNQGAQGLMQVMPGNAGGANLLNPQQNIQRGVDILAQNLKATGGDKSKASAMYFAGPNTQEWGPKTHEYVQKVADNYNSLGSQNVPSLQPPQAPQQPSPGAMPDLSSYLSQPDQQSSSSASAADMPDLSAYLGAGENPTQEATEGNPLARGPSSATYQAAQSGDPENTALWRIGSAAVDGVKNAWGDEPILHTVPGSGPAQFAGQMASNAIAIPATIARGAGALMGGAQGAVAQTGAELGQPELGRDIAALPEAFVGEDPVASAPGAMDAARSAEDYAATAAGAKMGRAAKAGTNPLPDEPAPPAAPQSAGAAATPDDLTPMTPEEAASAEASDNLRRLTSQPVKGDATVYVPGNIRTELKSTAIPQMRRNAGRERRPTPSP